MADFGRMLITLLLPNDHAGADAGLEDSKKAPSNGRGRRKGDCGLKYQGAGETVTRTLMLSPGWWRMCV